MTQYTPLRPLATVLAWHAQLEADLTNPKGSEPLTVGSGFPPGYTPVYDWTSVVVLALYDDDGNEIPLLNPPSATIAMPELQSGHGSGWAHAQVITLEPGLVPADFNPTVAKWFTDPLPMAQGIALADQVDAGGGPPRTDVIRIPRPLAGEQPTENDATWIVLAISDDSQQNDFPQGTHWNAVLPKVERGHFEGVQASLYPFDDTTNVASNITQQGRFVVEMRDTIPDSLRAVKGLGDIALAAPTPPRRPILSGAGALGYVAANRSELTQQVSPLAQVLSQREQITIYTVARFAQMQTLECAWSIGVGAADQLALWWYNGRVTARRNASLGLSAPHTDSSRFSIFCFVQRSANDASLYIDAGNVGTLDAGALGVSLRTGSATLGNLLTLADDPNFEMQGDVAEWTTCLAAHSDVQIQAKTASLRSYWMSRGLVMAPLAPLNSPPPPPPPPPVPQRHTIVGVDEDRDGTMDTLVSHTIEDEEPDP